VYCRSKPNVSLDCRGLSRFEKLKGDREGQRSSRLNLQYRVIYEIDGKVDIGKKRAEQLAHAFGVHPAIIMFPEYEAELIQKVA
jgi:hypothetical protein